MQREIQALVVALYNEQKKESEVLQSILASIAVGGAARRAMIRDIAIAVAATETSASETSMPKEAWYEGDVAKAIQSIRMRGAA